MGWVAHKAGVGVQPKSRLDEREARLLDAIRKTEGQKRAELEQELARVRLQKAG